MKLSILALFITATASAQIGVGTTNPQETLHVNGTVRVESLGVTNTLNNGTSTTVSVDGDGTLILSNNVKIQGKIAPNGNAIKISGATCSRINNGDYRIVFNTPLTDNDYIILLTNSNNGGFGASIISYYNQTNNGFRVKIKDAYWLADVNVQFMFKVFN